MCRSYAVETLPDVSLLFPFSSGTSPLYLKVIVLLLLFLGQVFNGEIFLTGSANAALTLHEEVSWVTQGHHGFPASDVKEHADDICPSCSCAS